MVDIRKIVDELNNEAGDLYSRTLYNGFIYQTNGYWESVYFSDFHLWNSEGEVFDTEDQFKAFLRLELKNLIKELKVYEKVLKNM